MRIFINKQDESGIFDLLKTSNPLNEIEWRIGKKSINSTDKFNPQLNLAQYSELLTRLKLEAREGNDIKDNLNVYIVDYYPSGVNPSGTNTKGRDGNIRHIKYNIVNNVASFKEIYQFKQTIKNVDIMLNKCNVRLSCSKEEVANKPTGNITYTRKITRNSFDFGDYIIELSVVNSNNERDKDSKSFNETTYEVEIELVNRKDIQTIMQSLKKVLIILYPTTNFLYPRDEEQTVIKKYNSFFTEYIYEAKKRNPHFDTSKLFLFENRAVNIKPNTKLVNYTITNKLDGVNYFLFCCDTGIYLINKNDSEKISVNPVIINGKLLNCILVGELKDLGFGIFDVLFVDKTDLTKIDGLFERLKYINFIDNINKLLTSNSGANTSGANPSGNYNIYIKSIKYNPNNLMKSLQEIVCYMYDQYSKFAYEENDGLIFTCVNGTFKQNKIYKYKWPSKLSIDFLIDNITVVSDILKTAKVYVQGKNNQILNFNTQRAELRTTLDVNKLSINPLFNIIKNGDIVECVWDFDSSVWIPYKIRYDKDKPNFIDVAKDVFEDINNNPDVMDIVTNNMSKDDSKDKTSVSDPSGRDSSGRDTRPLDNNTEMCLTNFNKYSNVEKRKLIEKYATGVVLDLGTGKLGDIHKYNKNKHVKKLWGVEPDEFNRTEALKRLSEKADLRIDVKILPFKAQETEKIVDAVKDEVDVVSSFFSLTFFFENKNILNSFCETVSRNLKAGGHFIGTTMDGQRTFNLLKGKSSLSVPHCYHITKKYKDTDKGIGQMLDIRLENTIVDQTEWLAWFDIFTDTMKSHGLSLVESTYFNNYDELSIHESTLFHCYRSFVFKKITVFEGINPFKNLKLDLPKVSNTQILSQEESDTELTEADQRKQDNKARLKVERKNKLKMLDTDETEPFDNLYGEQQQLTRIGTIGDGSCFFHSVLYLIDKKYRKYSEDDRGELVKIIRELFGDSISRKKWKSMGNGNLALTFFLIKLSEEYPDIVPDTSVKNVDELITKLKAKYPKLSDEFDQLLEEVYQEYIESVKDCDVWVGENLDSVNLFEYICEIFDINIYIIRDSTRKPYLMGSDCSLLYKNRPSIIILWINDSHYEAVSVDDKLLFQFNDPVIQRIHNIICGK